MAKDDKTDMGSDKIEPIDKPKHPGGRPTKYKPEYCELLIEHMAGGHSFESFAGRPDVRVNIDTLYEWAKVHPQFSEAKSIGYAASFYQWEDVGLTHEHSPPGQWSSVAWVFRGKTRYGLRDGGELPKKELTEQNEKLANVSKQLEQLIDKK